MAFIKVSEYAKKHKVSNQNVYIKIRKKWFNPSDVICLEKVGRYLINENAIWPMHEGGRKPEIKEKANGMSENKEGRQEPLSSNP